MKVAEVMTTDVIRVTPLTSLKDAARIMLQNGVSGLPVVDDSGALIGIVTEADFVEEEAAHAWSYRRSLLDPLFGRGEAALRKGLAVEDVMTTRVATVAPDVALAAAARHMSRRKVKRLPVVDADGDLVGIVSRADVMKAFVRADDEIRADIDRILRGWVLPIDPEAITVDVDEGVVTLAGEVDARVDARLLVDFVEHIDGVVAVRSSLSWRVDDRRSAGGWAPFSQEGSGR